MRRPWILLSAALAAAALCAGALMAVRRPLRPDGADVPRATRNRASAASAASAAEPGPYKAGWRQVTVSRADGTAFTALLAYPAITGGEDAAYDGGGGPYPAVAFGHGFLQTPRRYLGTFEHLATWGYFVIAPESHAGVSPDHESFADDLLAALNWLSGQDADSASWLSGQVDSTRFGLSGHSMGAGASLLAAANEPSIRAVANLAAAETRPSAVAAMPRMAAPIALIVGSEDSIVPPAATAEMYRAAAAPKQLVTILGGYHCGFQDDPFPVGCDRGSLAREEQLAITRRRLIDFFGLYLKEDRTLFDDVWGPPTDQRLALIAEPGGSAAQTPACLPSVGNGG